MLCTPPTLLARIYQALIRLYPAHFRAEFGAEMVCDFDDGMFEAWTASGWPGVLSLWLLVAGDFLRTLIVQWFRTGVPALILISATWATMCAKLIAYQFVPRPKIVTLIPPRNADEEMRLVLVSVTIVVLVIVVTVLVTGWFWTVVLRRRRA